MKDYRSFLAVDLRGFRRLKFLSLILFMSIVSFGTNEDSLKGKYDINDPRNPKCPCHKFQKIADEEYKQLLSKLNKDKKTVDELFAESNPPSGNVTGNSNHRNLSGNDEIKKKRNDWNERVRSKKKLKKHTRWRKLKESVHRGFWKRQPNADSCFKWRK